MQFEHQLHFSCKCKVMQKLKKSGFLDQIREYLQKQF